jgi:hypothetical protein
MGRTACTEPQCLYKGALYLYLFSHKWSHALFNQITVYHFLGRTNKGAAACIMTSKVVFRGTVWPNSIISVGYGVPCSPDLSPLWQV